MSSRFEPTSQQARLITLLGYREVSAPHAGLFSQLAPVGATVRVATVSALQCIRLQYRRYSDGGYSARDATVEEGG
jgi:hypothetical protein